MGFDFSAFETEQLDEAFVAWQINEQALERWLHFERLWGYYHNEMADAGARWVGDEVSEASRPYRQAQEYGLPSRITGRNYSFYGGLFGATDAVGANRKEVVIENDIAWRVDAMVDFLFGKRVGIVSRAREPRRAEEITGLLNAVFDANGGASFFQELALLGSVYGFVDVVLRSGGLFERQATGTAHPREQARRIMLEPLEAPRCVPILDENNYRRLAAYVQHFWQLHNRLADDEQTAALVNRQGRHSTAQKQTHRVEVIGADYWQLYDDGEVIAAGRNPLGVVPVVHIQNMPKPRYYEGQGDVEPLIPLQDELNTRLSDRANRVTFQSFKMYLGKGIEGFENRVVAPGRMWSTENPEATIECFGGDEGSPSESEHIAHIREALDKASGVASVAAGILKGRIGNLTSAVALKVTLMGLLAKTERKRLSYGEGIRNLCRLILQALDAAGVYRTAPEEREIGLQWPSPLPENVQERLQEALLKQELGVPRETLLAELGYGAEAGGS